MSEVDNFVLRLLALPTDTIVVLHETEEKAPDSTPEKPKFTGRVDVYPPRYRMLLKYLPKGWPVKLTQTVVANNQLRLIPSAYTLPTAGFYYSTKLPLA